MSGRGAGDPAADSLSIIHLERPRGNAINHAFIEAASAALDRARSAEIGAVVITGRGKAFCAGLDLIETLLYDEHEMGRFVDAFEAFFEQVFTFPKPVVAAINGHAIAGGCILAMACDFCVMVDGPYRIGVNEVEVGIPFPAVAFEIMRAALRVDAQAVCLLEGRKLSPNEAKEFGLVGELTSADDLLPQATTAARRLAKNSPTAYAAIKGDLRSPVLRSIRETSLARKHAFLAAWFSPASVEWRTATVRALQNP